MKSNDILFFLMGLAVSVFGVKIIIHPEYESFRFGPVNFGGNHQLIGAVILVVGALAIFSVLRKKTNR